MAQKDVMQEYKEQDRLKVDDYVEILRKIGGTATTREIGEAAGRAQETVSKVFARCRDGQEDRGNTKVETFEDGVPVERVTRGATHVYRITDDAQEGEDG